MFCFFINFTTTKILKTPSYDVSTFCDNILSCNIRITERPGGRIQAQGRDDNGPQGSIQLR